MGGTVSEPLFLELGIASFNSDIFGSSTASDFCDVSAVLSIWSVCSGILPLYGGGGLECGWLSCSCCAKLAGGYIGKNLGSKKAGSMF